MPVPWAVADIKRNAPGVILIVAVFAALFAMDPHKWANDASPIRSAEPIDATVKSVQLDHGRGIYLVSAEDGSSFLVEDERPHLIGAHANIELVTRENGSTFYRFAN
jgi:hypothetical protein